MSNLTQPHHQAIAQLTSQGAPFELIDVETANGPRRAYKNAPQSLVDILNQGRQFGDQPFVEGPTSRYTFNQFFAANDALAAQLAARFALQPGQHVAIAMRNSPEWLIAFTAIIYAGAVAVPLNSWGRREELRQGLTDSNARLVICDQQRCDFIDPEQLQLPYLLFGDSTPAGALGQNWQTALAEGAEQPAVTHTATADDAAILLFTSGTSGRPKGAQFSHFNCGQALFNIELIGAATYMTNTATLDAYLAKQLPSKTLLAIPLFHIGGLFSQFIANLKHGRGLYVMHKWDAAEAARLVKEAGITVLMGAPVMMAELLESGRLDEQDTARLANISAGGSATPDKLYDLYDKYCAGCMSGAGWGLTETGGTGAAFTGHIMRARRGSAGFVSPIIELKFRDTDGNWISDGSAGEIWVRSAACIDHYTSGASDTADFEDGWFNSGDIGYLNDEGLLYLCDRAKDVIIRGGENIYPVEVENCLLSLPSCEEVAVVGLPCERYGERVGAVVRLSPAEPRNEAAIIAHCRDHLAGFKVPEQIVFTDTPLPRNATQKLLKSVIVNDYFSAA